MYEFAVLPYLNAVPLVHFLPAVCPGAVLRYGNPREMLPKLTSRGLDAAIIPVVDYFSTPGLEKVRGLGICADGEVQSVLLQCRRPLEQVRTISLDPASKTSNQLARLLLRRHFKVRQEIRFCIEAVESDARVVIGDRALLAEHFAETYDLASEWKSMTGLPFVFAVWVYRADHPQKQRLSEILHAAKDAGCEAIPQLSKLYADRVGLPETRCRRYLTSCLHHSVGPKERRSMQLFRELARSLEDVHIKGIKEEPRKTRGIVRNEREYRGVEPVPAFSR